MAAKPKIERCGPPKLRHAVNVCMKRSDTKPSAPMKDAQGVCRYLKGVKNSDRESFYVLHLNVRNQVIGAEEVARGTLTGVEVHPRETFKSAILNNAEAVILAHNHPSGDPTPSNSDVQLTARLADAGRMLGIPVRDHVILGKDECVSVRSGFPSMSFGQHKKKLLRAAERRPSKKCESTMGSKIVEWAVGGILLGTIGGIFWWKWNQISSSGVPLAFALRRTFSKFGEGRIDLVQAYERQKRT